MPDAAKTLKKKVAFFRADAGTIDWPFAIIVLILVAFGLVMVFSASYATALYRFDDSFKFIRQQAIFAFGGVIVMFFVGYKIDYHILHRFAWPLMLGALALLVIVLFMEPLNGARRWIVIPSLGTLQPSEVAKFAVIVLFAHIISINHKRMKKFSYGVLPFAVILIIIAGLMLMEPHLSGTVLIMGIGASMMFVGGTGIIWFVLAVLGAVAGVAGAVVFKPDLVPYALERIETWQNPWLDSLGSGHQTIQSLYAISSGGLTGLGIGNSRQKHLYLPEPHNDFIFSVICEELGFIGALLVIFLFIALLLRGLYIAYTAKDKFGSMLVVGIMVQVILQAVLNIGVVTNTIPNTGISLPFFSYGGTSLLMLLGEMGVVLSVSREGSGRKT
ncbi:putative lipid II flippase FtsW [Ruthenibacterium sp. CLA-JM-H11]|uniref:Probable peptidoglycan glycosyltransferase FtsW n=1 Tax=Ruthenibacterium intestinale TaxID=3133163 RepID=A0ABV1GCR4_9FIRM